MRESKEAKGQEMVEARDAYQSHIQTAHFKKYKEGTAQMVKSLKLIDSRPLVKPDFGKMKVKY